MSQNQISTITPANTLFIEQSNHIYTRLEPLALLALGPLVVLVPLEDFPIVVGLRVGARVIGADVAAVYV